MRAIPYPKEVYRHFKGNTYEIVTLAKDANTEEDIVVYKALYPPYIVYTRPLEEFLSKTDKNKYPQATQEFRFEKVEEKKTFVQPEPSVPEQDELMVFLEAETYDAKLHVLSQMSETITDELITAMAISLDLEIEDGTTQERLYTLKKCLTTMQKYEGIRLRE